MDRFKKNLALSKVEIKLARTVMSVWLVKDDKLLTINELSDKIIRKKGLPKEVKNCLPENFLEQEIGAYNYRSLSEDANDLYCDNRNSADIRARYFLKILYTVLEQFENHIIMVREQSFL
ncbi:hypothetical protein COT94_00945 [Candidatus Falkowbacteria bacterium CG10_big_fil_rev_8_21_14_0_10_37_14]|uniref:Uncharacterized protein n=1 Tax=Candidatus Falkowbacteria bacterium CG10_big_fil_rev_8_21_14_0_10_37_14 TaxID=1974561 RepID=A0A2M6WUF1_9BACT|nr:hypothetical protein [Candidatus Falkowbacteria bacterium]PIT96346.1 MAG: hypothetical protein COT94_00945 [Candidatus Falkowbacteria bacterium CG10_big_fil_rev_8_21_14_0_10_37_14]